MTHCSCNGLVINSSPKINKINRAIITPKIWPYCIGEHREILLIIDPQTKYSCSDGDKIFINIASIIHQHKHKPIIVIQFPNTSYSVNYQEFNAKDILQRSLHEKLDEMSSPLNTNNIYSECNPRQNIADSINPIVKKALISANETTSVHSVSLNENLIVFIRFNRLVYGALNETHIKTFRLLKCNTVHICGFDTETNVLATAFQVFDAGFKPIIHINACSSERSSIAHDAALALMGCAFGTHCLKAWYI